MSLEKLEARDALSSGEVEAVPLETVLDLVAAEHNLGVAGETIRSLIARAEAAEAGHANFLALAEERFAEIERARRIIIDYRLKLEAAEARLAVVEKALEELADAANEAGPHMSGQAGMMAAHLGRKIANARAALRSVPGGDGKGISAEPSPCRTGEADRQSTASLREQQLSSLVECLVRNEPDDIVAEGGVTCLMVWRQDAERVLAMGAS
jgi:hypothetical protein